MTIPPRITYNKWHALRAEGQTSRTAGWPVSRVTQQPELAGGSRACGPRLNPARSTESNRGLTLQTEALQQEQAPSLRRWLGERSGSERTTLARLWGLPEPAGQPGAALAEAMLAALERVLAGLRPAERAALTLVQQYGGQIDAPLLEREYGGIRSLGDYPNPRAYLLALEQPATPVERLWMLGLLLPKPASTARTYAIPAEILLLLPPAPAREQSLRLTPAGPPEHVYTADPARLERLLMALLALAQDGQLELTRSGALSKAALRRLAGPHQPAARPADEQQYLQFARWIGEAAGLLKVGADERLRPSRTALDWLRSGQATRTQRLLDGWIASAWDELAVWAGVTAQREFARDLAGAKRAALQLIGQAPPAEWVALDEFVSQVRRTMPDFARPDRRYDSWGLLSRTRQPLDGFVFWEAVEGAQLRAIVCRTLSWLGLVDVGQPPSAFRLTALGAALLAGQPAPAEPPAEPLVIQANFEVIAPRYASPYARFQLGRLAERTSAQLAEIYTLSKRSIHAALQRGIAFDDMLRFLHEHAAAELPPNVAATLRDWASQYGQVALRPGILLESEDALLLEQITRDRRVRMPRHQRLSEHAWLVRAADAHSLAERLRKAGYGVAGQPDAPHTPLREHDLTVIYTALEFYAQAADALAIEHDAGPALRRRIARLLPEKLLNRAFQASRTAVQALRERLDSLPFT